MSRKSSRIAALSFCLSRGHFSASASTTFVLSISTMTFPCLYLQHQNVLLGDSWQELRKELVSPIFDVTVTFLEKKISIFSSAPQKLDVKLINKPKQFRLSAC